MTTIPSAARSTDPARPHTATRRVAAAATVGTALESYDFYTYSYFAAFFAERREEERPREERRAGGVGVEVV